CSHQGGGRAADPRAKGRREPPRGGEGDTPAGLRQPAQRRGRPPAGRAVRSFVAALLAAAALLALMATAEAEVLHGTVVGLGSARLTLRSDDGQTYHADLTDVDRAVRAAVAIGDKVTVSGDVASGRVAAKYVD